MWPPCLNSFLSTAHLYNAVKNVLKRKDLLFDYQWLTVKVVHLVIHSSVSPKFWNENVNSDYKTASWQPWLHHTQCESKLITTKHNRFYGVSSGNSFWLCESKRFMFRRYVFLLRMWPKSYYIDQKNIQIILNRRSFLIFCFFYHELLKIRLL